VEPHIQFFENKEQHTNVHPDSLDGMRTTVKKAMTTMLSYHIVPQALNPGQLFENTTFATNLARIFGALDNEPRRIRIGKTALPIGLSINLH